MDEGLGDDVTAVHVDEGSCLHHKENECSIRPPESSNVLEPQEPGTPDDLNFEESSLHVFEEILEANADASKQPSASPQYMDDAGNMVEELMVRNYDNTNLAIVGTSNNRGKMQTRPSQWQHLFQLTCGSASGNARVANGEPMPNSLEQNMTYKPLPGLLRQKGSSTDQNEEVEELGNANSGNVIPQSGIKTKILSKSGFSEYFIKKSLTGKGIIFRGSPHEGIRMEPRDQNNGKGSGSTLITPNASPSLGGKLSAPSSFGMARTEPGSFDNEGTCLRDLLKVGRCKMKKVESLHVFRQIVELVDHSHSQGVTLNDFRPSCFRLLRSNQVKYVGFSVHRNWFGVDQGIPCPESHVTRRWAVEQGVISSAGILPKKQKLSEKKKFIRRWPPVTSKLGVLETPNDDGNSSFLEPKESSKQYYRTAEQQSTSVSDWLEKKWYASPEELSNGIYTSSSNIYSMGVLLFELLGRFDSERTHETAMVDFRNRILPPTFLSENPKEAGFCLWLTHPEPSSRPTTREILQSEVVTSLNVVSTEELSSSIDHEGTESELLLHFLVSLKEQKESYASKLVEDISCLESDLLEVESRRQSREPRTDTLHQFSVKSSGNETRLINNISQLKSAYFSMRSKLQLAEANSTIRQDKDVLRNRGNCRLAQEAIKNEHCKDSVGAFFDGLCKYARYSKFKVRGLLRTGDFSNSANVICSLSFDRDMDYFAAAGVSKKIKIFELESLFNDSVDIHYPVTEMPNKSKLSCVCWSSYIKNYLASTDYDGIVKLWDANTGQEIFQYNEHERRAWSVDFSQVYPTKLASGSDDCSVKLWSMNEKNSLGTIRNMANVCCVQFSSHSTHLLAFGSADYRTYCYDLRNVRSPWCILSGHNKAVSHVKFLDSETLVTASTDNSLKLWDLNNTNSSGLSTSACSLTFSGHTNEKNFVGLSVADGYIACGSETNEVYIYYRSLPMPITSHIFGSVDPITGKETDDDNGQFVSSVCWKGNSVTMIAANSSGRIKVLQVV